MTMPPVGLVKLEFNDKTQIKRSIVSYRGHLSHGHTYKLRKKVMADFVLTKATKSGGGI